jgi:hypothetical protein
MAQATLAVDRERFSIVEILRKFKIESSGGRFMSLDCYSMNESIRPPYFIGLGANINLFQMLIKL